MNQRIPPSANPDPTTAASPMPNPPTSRRANPRTNRRANPQTSRFVPSLAAPRSAWADLVSAATIGIDAAKVLPGSLATVGPDLPGLGAAPADPQADSGGESTAVGPVAALQAAALLHAARRGGLGPGKLYDPLPAGAATPYRRAPNHASSSGAASSPNGPSALNASNDPSAPNTRTTPNDARAPNNPADAELPPVPLSVPLSVRLAERILAAGPPVAAELAGQAARRGRIVPAGALAAWVAGASLDPDLAAAAVPLLGPRGRWLAAANPDWRHVVQDEEDPAATALDPSATVAPQQRTRLFRSARQTDPHGTRDRLERVWTRHPPPVRAALLGQFRIGLSRDDEPFLERALTDRSAAVRPVAAELLSALPDSAFRARVAGAIAQVVRPQASGALTLATPTPQVAALVAGLAAGPEQTALHTLARLAPLDAWSRASGREPAELVTAAVDPPEAADAVAAGWQAATLTQRDAVWAAVFLAGCAPSDHRRAAPLLAVLAAATQDPATARTVSDRLSRLPATRASGLGRTPDAAPADELAAVPGPWTADVAAPSLGHLEQRMRGAPPDPADHRAAQLIALRADPAWLRPRLGDLLALTPSLSRWRPVLLVAADLADLRHRLEQESP